MGSSLTRRVSVESRLWTAMTFCVGVRSADVTGKSPDSPSPVSVRGRTPECSVIRLRGSEDG